MRESETEYVVELDVADFTGAELTIEAVGPVVTVRGEQVKTEADAGQPFRIHERLEETFRLPDDSDLSCRFVERTGGEAVIGTLGELEALADGTTGTLVLPRRSEIGSPMR